MVDPAPGTPAAGKPPKPYKAIAGSALSAAIAFGQSLATALQGAGVRTLGDVTAGQWVASVVSALVALGAAIGVNTYVGNSPH